MLDNNNIRSWFSLRKDQKMFDQEPNLEFDTLENLDTFSHCNGSLPCAICAYIDNGEGDGQILGQLPNVAEIDRLLSPE